MVLLPPLLSIPGKTTGRTEGMRERKEKGERGERG